MIIYLYYSGTEFSYTFYTFNTGGSLRTLSSRPNSYMLSPLAYVTQIHLSFLLKFHVS